MEGIARGRGEECEVVTTCSRDAGSGRRSGGDVGSRPFSHSSMYMASLDVKTAADVTGLELLAEMLERTGMLGHIVAALVEEMTHV